VRAAFIGKASFVIKSRYILFQKKGTLTYDRHLRRFLDVNERMIKVSHQAEMAIACGTKALSAAIKPPLSIRHMVIVSCAYTSAFLSLLLAHFEVHGGVRNLKVRL